MFDVKEDAKMTFSELAEWYLDLEKITPADLENYQAIRLKAGMAPATIDHEIGKTRTMIIKAFDNRKISGETMRTFKSIKNMLKKGKDKEKRSIPICDELYEMLTNVTRHINDPHVFLYRGKPVADIRTGLVKACKKAGIIYGRFKKGGFIFHDLRHTFNTNMRKSGVTESVIMAITGHSTREMFDRYNTVDLEDTRNLALRTVACRCYRSSRGGSVRSLFNRLNILHN